MLRFMQNRNLLLSPLFLSLITLTGCQVIQPLESYDEKNSYEDSQNWGYHEGSIMPNHWGDEEVNKLCKIGQEQSPINITKVHKPQPHSDNSFDLKTNYNTQKFSVVNNGHTVVFNAVDSNKSQLSINGKSYDLLQFHYHVPSEHTVMHTQYPLEVHFVHKSSDGLLAVVGVLFKQGETNKALERVINNLPKTNQTDVMLKDFDVDTLIPADSKTYAYNGSLTTPPCSEQVQWLLKKDAVNAGAGQLHTLANLYHGNNRPVQIQGGRVVSFQ